MMSSWDRDALCDFALPIDGRPAKVTAATDAPAAIMKSRLATIASNLLSFDVDDMRHSFSYAKVAIQRIDSVADGQAGEALEIDSKLKLFLDPAMCTAEHRYSSRNIIAGCSSISLMR